MNVRDLVVEGIVRTEGALDHLKLAYKTRFRRFAPAHIVTYRGHGRPDRLVLRGRVMEANEVGFDPEPSLLTNIRNTIRRLETDEIRGARLRARFRDLEVELSADGEAFFDLTLEPGRRVEAGWHPVELEIIESMAHENTGPVTGEVLVPPEDADFLVVSDLDDTVLRTGATDRFAMFRTVLLNDARTRLPFQGVRALYRALERGPSGRGRNPFFYLSRSPWNLYEMLAGFLEHHQLPKGPLLLKEYGLRGVLDGREEPYKRRALTELLAFYPDHRLVLIGDSGQHDPEIYREIALARADRVRAIIIRDVTPPARDREVHAIADELKEAGVPVILAEESVHAAREAAALGLVEEAALAEVEADEASETKRSVFRRLLDGSLHGGDGA